MTFKEFEIEEKAQELVINKIKELMTKINEKREAVIDKMFEEMGYSKDEYMQMLSSPYLLDDITSIDVYIDDELVSTFICNRGTIKRHDDSYSMEMKYGYKIYKRM